MWQTTSRTARSTGPSTLGPTRSDQTRRWTLERTALARLLRWLGDPPVRVVLWDGTELAAATPRTLVTVRINSRLALYRLLIRPGVEVGECFRDGSIDLDGDLVSLFETVGRATPRTPPLIWRATSALRRYAPTHRLRSAAKNADAHYGIDRRFFSAWLDPSMTYTCARFPRASASLEEAQHHKLETICKKLALRADERVVEAGCGWGSLALHMAGSYGVRVRAFNVSREQLEFAREEAARRGLTNRVEFVEDDYRNIHGQYDAFVSVGMLEHVGMTGYRAFGSLIRNSLAPGGRGLIHSIGRDRPYPTNPWISRRIFPGGYTPSLREMLTVLEPNGLSVLDVENLRNHYALTLGHWLARLEQQGCRLTEDFGEPLVRSWRLYLASAQAAFSTGWLQLFQVLFGATGDNRARWARVAG